MQRMDQIGQLLNRGVEKIYPSKEALEKLLRSGKKLTLYQGFDPTGTQLHIGHMIGLRKLRQWQDLGHHVIFLIGDGTGQAGDPSGKSKARNKFFTQQELRANATDYVKQAGRIVRFEGENPVEIRFNGDWLNKLSLPDILDLAGHFTLQQLSERDFFQERIKRGEAVNLREFLYPLLQGYDSVAMSVDLELGGSDQTFNMLCGRTLVSAMQGREKFVMTTPLLTDSQGRKIGKTEGNVIGLNDQSQDLFGKIMSLSDDVISKGLEYLTNVSQEEIDKIQKELTAGANPMAAKKRLAFEITKELHSEAAAKDAQEHFERVVQQGENPQQIPVAQLAAQVFSFGTSITSLLVAAALTPSSSEAKRLITQGAVELDGQVLTDPVQVVKPKEGQILKVGKRRIVRLAKGA